MVAAASAGSASASSLPSGAPASGGGGAVIVFEQRLSYADLFKPGRGVGLQLDVMYRQRGRGGSVNPDIGAYVAFHFDRFGAAPAAARTS